MVKNFPETKMTGLHNRKEGKMVNISLCKGDKVVEKNSVFGKYSDAELVAKLKVLALDPCNSQFSRNNVQSLWNQTIRVRKAMALSDNDFPRRKRKLQQFVKEKLIAPPGSLSGLPCQHKFKKLNKYQVSHASSASCLLNSVESFENFDQRVRLDSYSSNSFEDSVLEKQISSESSFIGDTTEWSSLGKDRFLLVDSDESINGSKPISLDNLTPQELPLSNLIESSYSSPLAVDNSNQKHLQTPRRSPRLLNFIGDHIQRNVVPVGSSFQADVPEWTVPCTSENDNSERWLGTRIWPPEYGKSKITEKDVGKGRPDSCSSCAFPGSIECIRRHILEKRLVLQCDLGPVFFSWKFDEMGEQVSKSWTLEQQKKFESLARGKSPSNGKGGFFKYTSKCFPYKCPKSIMSYYFNVFVPRRISMRTRLSLKQVDDSDEDEGKDFNYLGFQKKLEERISTMRSPSSSKTQYINRSLK